MSDFYIEKKTYYHDTDCGGVVYYANYLKYLEEGRHEYCAHKGIDLKELARSGIYFVVAHVDISYKSPLRYQEQFRIYTKVEKTGNASLNFKQWITRQETACVEANTVWVCVGKDFLPQPIPQLTKQQFQK